MKNIIYILMLSYFFVSCSKADGIDLENTFLEKYEGTVWLKDNAYESVYIRFINDLENPLEYWKESVKCYYYFLEIIYKEDLITKNYDDILEIEYVRIIDESKYINLITLTAFDDSIVLESKHYEDGKLISVEILDYFKSNEDVDSFVICKRKSIIQFEDLSLINL